MLSCFNPSKGGRERGRGVKCKGRRRGKERIYKVRERERGTKGRGKVGRKGGREEEVIKIEAEMMTWETPYKVYIYLYLSGYLSVPFYSDG